MATMLKLDRLTKRYGAETVLDGVSLSVAEGETVAIFGPSGSGKTVLLRLISGMSEPEDGELLINGRDVVGTAPEERGVGMAFQNFALFPHMSAYENIASPLQARKSTAAKVKEGVDRVARLLKIDHVLGHAPRQLSNGQKQRTALARALVAAPKLLLLDDPLRNVDAKLRFEMRLELPRLLQGFGSTVLYVTQDYREAMALGNRIAVLVGGRFVQVGNPEEIYDRPATVEVARLFGDPTINLIEAEIQAGNGGPVAVVGEGRLPLAPGYDGLVGRRAVLGIRPEDIDYAEPGDPQAVPVRVAALLPLNDRLVRLLVGRDGQEFNASKDAGARSLGEGAETAFRAAPTSIILFDPATGQRIAPQAH
ncbi:ABC transporter ATP-binding protein [Aureimonas endophytica]|uniref:ABC transporter ATP-binding protein n=1 Tax=Aureimonas endophytica TaxID=2027858 RepID=A0A916ZBU6_9HYPH|nr:ABC transporter ATP-binding protein [Aureimonas endophytica]GGD86950.1 ABC transporter ATP-binding protein [Aureimonas endophytica]